MVSAGHAPLAACAALDAAGAGLMVALCTVWSLRQISIRAGGGDVSPVLMVALRSGIAAVLLALVLWRGAQVPAWHRGRWRPRLLAGAFFTLEFLLVAESLRLTQASHVVVLLYTAPLFSALGLHLALPAERMQRRQWLGVVIAFAGIALAFLGHEDAAGSAAADAATGTALRGDGLALLAGAAWAASTVTIRCTSLAESPAGETLLYQLLAFLLLMPAAWAMDQAHFQPTATAWAHLAFQGMVVSFASFLVWVWLLRRYQAVPPGGVFIPDARIRVRAGHVAAGRALAPAVSSRRRAGARRHRARQRACSRSARSMSTPPLRIALASLTFEGNSFSPVVAGLVQFERCYLLRGQALVDALAGTRDAVAGALQALAGQALQPLLAADAGAGGRVSDACYATLKAEILQGLSSAAPVHGVMLALHGAMLTESLDDAEGDLLEAVRAAVGPRTPIAVSLDLHAQLTPRMVAAADVIVGFKAYPHDDAFETGQQAATLLLRTLRGEIRPAMALRRVAMLTPVTGQVTRPGWPMNAVQQGCRDLERSGLALAASFFGVQPWLDLPDTASSAVVVVDTAAQTSDQHKTRALAASAAEALCLQAWALRHRFLHPLHSPAEAAAEAIERLAGQAAPRHPVLMADVADCVGGGAPGTSAAAAAGLLAAAPQLRTLAMVVAPAAVAAAQAAGAGAVVSVVVGDTAMPPRLPLQATVRRLADGHFRYTAGPLGGVAACMGPCAVLETGSLTLLAASHGVYEYGAEHYAAVGIDVADFDAVIVKNPVNARLAIPAANFLVLDTPGPTSPHLGALPWQRLGRPCFPLDDSDTPIWR